MDYAQLLFSVHWLPVFVVTLSSLVIGTVWYRPFLFGRIWTRETNPAGGEPKLNKPLKFVVTAIFHIIAFANLSLVVAGQGWPSGLLTGLAISIVWVLPALGTSHLFADRSWRLVAIDAGQYVVLYSLGGLALGLF